MSSPAPGGERLQKVLAHAGIASRRAAEDYILAGRVAVNGQVVTTLGTRVNPARDQVTVDGAVIAGPAAARSEKHVTYLLHKPPGVVSTASDPQGRPTVVSLVPTEPRVYPVGRLDADTEGLLLLTNDGDLAFRLTHPRYAVDKEYEVLVRGSLSQDALRRLREGLLLEGEDRPTAPAQVDVLAREGDNSLVRFVIHEGRTRQVRRMVGAVNGSVLRLRRVRLGPLTLGDLALGQWRPLTARELRDLDRAAGPADPAAKPLGARPAAPGTLPDRVRPAPQASKPAGARPEPQATPGRATHPSRRSSPASRSAPGRPGHHSGPSSRPVPGPPWHRSGPSSRPASGPPWHHSGPPARPAPGPSGPRSGPPARPAPGPSGPRSGPPARPAPGPPEHRRDSPARSGPRPPGPRSGPPARPAPRPPAGPSGPPARPAHNRLGPPSPPGSPARKPHARPEPARRPDTRPRPPRRAGHD